MEVSSLIDNLKNTTRFDKENVLLDIYIFLKERYDKGMVPVWIQVFFEITSWRDYSLRDGVQSYYEESKDNKKHISLNEYIQISAPWIYDIFHSGFETNISNYTEIDNWIFENQWKINDWLASLFISNSNRL